MSKSNKLLDSIRISFKTSNNQIIKWILVFDGLEDREKHGKFALSNAFDGPYILLASTNCDINVTIYRVTYSIDNLDFKSVTNIKTFNEEKLNRLLDLYNLGICSGDGCYNSLYLHSDRIYSIDIDNINHFFKPSV